MLHMYTKFEDDIFIHSSVITKNVFFSFIKEYRETTMRSLCDVIDNVITMKIFFSCIIWDDLFISNVKLKLYLIFWHFQNGRHFEVATKFLMEVTPEVEYTTKIALSICDILSFWSML